ncbi:thiosulfate oxidation carrier protein SoxY [Rubrimonas sp.]|uniref:thiosulfate oxidation carrier protein SoxY n=1 Tax=Rubrimonas sp. TaxID=2036015 RepID=UPI002FDE3DC7
MNFTRRQTFGLASGAAAFAAVAPKLAFAAADADAVVAAFTGGAAPQAGRITLTAPEIAENGNSVPVSISVESPMTDGDHVAEVLLLATGNPSPTVATFRFSPLAGSAAATTRVRLAKTQNMMAIAKMSDGSVWMDQSEVKVTIGGCGG